MTIKHYEPENYLDYCIVNNTYDETVLFNDKWTNINEFSIMIEVFNEIRRLMDAKADPIQICKELNIEGHNWIDAFWCLSRWRLDNFE